MSFQFDMQNLAIVAIFFLYIGKVVIRDHKNNKKINKLELEIVNDVKEDIKNVLVFIYGIVDDIEDIEDTDHKCDGSNKEASKGNNGDTSKGKSKDTSEGNNEDTSKGKSRDTSEGNNEDTSEGNNEDTSEGKSRDTSEGNSGDTSEGNSGDTSKGKSRDTSGGNNEDTSKGNKKNKKDNKDERNIYDVIKLKGRLAANRYIINKFLEEEKLLKDLDEKINKILSYKEQIENIKRGEKGEIDRKVIDKLKPLARELIELQEKLDAYIWEKNIYKEMLKNVLTKHKICRIILLVLIELFVVCVSMVCLLLCILLIWQAFIAAIGNGVDSWWVMIFIFIAAIIILICIHLDEVVEFFSKEDARNKKETM